MGVGGGSSGGVSGVLSSDLSSSARMFTPRPVAAEEKDLPPARSSIKGYAKQPAELERNHTG
jgi:hypothetical protein